MTALLLLRYVLSKLNPLLVSPAAGLIAGLAGMSGWRAVIVAVVALLASTALYEPRPDDAGGGLRTLHRQMKEIVALIDSVKAGDE